MLETTSQYVDRSKRLWDEALAALDEGNALQASEKLWGSAAQAVKAVGEARGWPHQSHRDLYVILRRLDTETGQKRLGQMFAIASALHQNFYEEWMAIEDMENRAADVQELREALAALLGPTPEG